MKIKNMVMMSKNNGQYRNIRALTGNTAFSNNVRKSFANMTQDFINYGSIDFENSLGSGLIAGGLSFINTQAIGLISNKLGAKFADEIFSSFGEILFERIAADLSRNIARRRNNPFGFSIGISQFY